MLEGNITDRRLHHEKLNWSRSYDDKNQIVPKDEKKRVIAKAYEVSSV